MFCVVVVVAGNLVAFGACFLIKLFYLSNNEKLHLELMGGVSLPTQYWAGVVGLSLVRASQDSVSPV